MTFWKITLKNIIIFSILVVIFLVSMAGFPITKTSNIFASIYTLTQSQHGILSYIQGNQMFYYSFSSIDDYVISEGKRESLTKYLGTNHKKNNSFVHPVETLSLLLKSYFLNNETRIKVCDGNCIYSGHKIDNSIIINKRINFHSNNAAKIFGHVISLAEDSIIIDSKEDTAIYYPSDFFLNDFNEANNEKILPIDITTLNEKYIAEKSLIMSHTQLPGFLLIIPSSQQQVSFDPKLMTVEIEEPIRYNDLKNFSTSLKFIIFDSYKEAKAYDLVN